MFTTNDLGELFAALSAAQGEFLDVTKDKIADAGKYKYAYADLPDIINATRPALAKHGLAVTQLTSGANDSITLTTILGHKSGQHIGDTWVIPAHGLNMQQMGSMITYARRYSYTSILGVAADKDDDGKDATERQREMTTSRNRAQQFGDKAAAAPTATNGNGHTDESDRTPVTPTNRVLASRLLDRFHELEDTSKSTAGLKDASNEVKTQWAVDLKALIQDINVQLTLRNMTKLRAYTDAADAYRIARTGISELIDYDTEAPVADEPQAEGQA